MRTTEAKVVGSAAGGRPGTALGAAARFARSEVRLSPPRRPNTSVVASGRTCRAAAVAKRRCAAFVVRGSAVSPPIVFGDSAGFAFSGWTGPRFARGPDGPRGRCAGGERLGASAGVRDRHDGGNCRVPRIGKAVLPRGRCATSCLRFWAQTQLLCATFAGIVAADSRATEKPLGGTGNRKTTEQDIPKPRGFGLRLPRAAPPGGEKVVGRRTECDWRVDGQVPVSTHSITASADVGVPAVARYSRTIARATSRSRLP